MTNIQQDSKSDHFINLFFNLPFLSSETAYDRVFPKMEPIPQPLMLFLQCDSDTSPVVQCNTSAVLEFGKLVSPHDFQGQVTKGNTASINTWYLLGCLLLENNHAVNKFKLAYVEKWVCKSFGRQPTSTRRHK